MPRAEIPEGMERFYIVPAVADHELVPHSEGPWIRSADLPAIKAHWLEQLKEELLGDEVKEAVAEALHDADFTVVLSEKLNKLPSYGGEITWFELAAAALKAAATSLDSIPIEEGGDV